MANRRMFSKTITSSSSFLMMPASSQNLYFQLGMNADDDGFCEHFTIMRMIEAKPDDLKILQAKGFVYVFDEKVLVITDWKENNYIQKDRYTPSKYLERYRQEIQQISRENANCPLGLPDVSILDTQVRLGKDRIEKKEEGDVSPPSLTFERKMREKDGEYRALVKDLCAHDFLTADRIHKIALEEFLPYWLEKSENGKKARWEKEKAFDYKLRFRTWIRRNHEKARDYRCKSDKWHRKGESCYCVKEEVTPQKSLAQMLPEVRALGLAKRV